jgi:uncharacterized protein YigE (DUF2233 family)
MNSRRAWLRCILGSALAGDFVFAREPAIVRSAAETVVEREGTRFRVVVAGALSIRVLWKDADGRQLKTFEAARRELRRAGVEPVMLMNGGIFEPGGIPSGLCVQDARELTPLNPREGKGNFFLKPNGVFGVVEGKAMVRETGEWAREGKGASQAIQSGPLLLRDGKIHPAFRAESPNLLHRNGVGVKEDGQVVFAITESGSRCNLHQFASFFLAQGCRDALFLDGDISQMWTAGQEEKPSNPFGSLLTVVPSV